MNNENMVMLNDVMFVASTPEVYEMCDGCALEDENCFAVPCSEAMRTDKQNVIFVRAPNKTKGEWHERN